MGLASRAAAQVDLPGGFSATHQMEYSYGESNLGGGTGDAASIFENWVELLYTRGEFNGGLRFVAFAPPDPVIYPEGPNTACVDFALAEYPGDRGTVRGGKFYALFGRGLALRSYENRSLRVDTNLLGLRGTLNLPDGELGPGSSASRSRATPRTPIGVAPTG